MGRNRQRKVKRKRQQGLKGVRSAIYQMPRGRVAEILDRYCFQVWETEALSKLRAALWTNVQDGTIPKEEIVG